MVDNVRKIPKILLCTALLLTSLIGPAAGREVPALKARVNDEAGILSTTTETQLEQQLTGLEQSDSTQIVVLTIDSLQGESLEQFSLKVVENWQIGQSDLDNGALLLIAVGERKVRIEVGYGLEGKLTDLMAGRIIRNVILPQFKQGDFNQGVVDGVGAMIATVRGEYTAAKTETGRKHDDYIGLIALMMFFLVFLGNMLRRKKMASAIAGGIGAPILGSVFQGFSLPLILLLIPVGIIGGFITSASHMHSGRSGRTGGFFMGSGGFGSSSGGFGGFSGGGGGFGGGGASGGW